MPWAALGGAVLGAGASIYGAKKASDNRPEYPDPFETARANFQANNFDRFTPFGSVRYTIDKMGTPDLSDDRYAMEQQYSPEMQGLLQVMMGRAGATPATFESQMPEGLRSKMAEVYGSDVPGSSYTPPEMAFGYDGGPAQIPEGAEDAYMGGGSPGQAWDIEPGQTTNWDLVTQAYNLGHLNDEDMARFQQHRQENPSIMNDLYMATVGPGELMSGIDERNPGIHPSWRGTLEKLYGSMPSDLNYPGVRRQPDDPPAENYDTGALEALLAALSEGGMYGN